MRWGLLLFLKFCLTLEPFQAGGFCYDTISPPNVMRPSELARIVGVSVDTLCYYERNRLLPTAQRSSSGYRLFPPEALMRVQMIRGALSVGFSIKELEQIFTIRDHGGTPCHQVRKVGTEKLRFIERQIRNLQSKHREMKKTLVNWDRLLKQAAHGKRAGLLEVLAHSKEKIYMIILVGITAALVLFFCQDPASRTKTQDGATKTNAQINERGEHAMGFSQTATTHHFLMKPEGGVIQVEANDPKDTASRDNIRMHLRHIANWRSAIATLNNYLKGFG